jgi:hypothetical protein
VLYVSLEGLGIGVAPSKHIDSPIPQKAHLEAITASGSCPCCWALWRKLYLLLEPETSSDPSRCGSRTRPRTQGA